jgi:hypothetical protein
MPKVNNVVSANSPVEEIRRSRITCSEIEEVKRLHILDNLCYRPEEVGQMFGGKSVQWVMERVRDGKFLLVDDCAKKSKNGLQASKGGSVTALSVEKFRQEYEISPEKWSE